MYASAEHFVALSILLIRCWTTATQSERSCGKTSFTDPSGIIVYPRLFLDGMMCNYSITMDENNWVSIKFLTFKIGSSREYESCSSSWLMISCPSVISAAESPWVNRNFCGQINWSSALRISGCKTLILHMSRTTYYSNEEFEVQIQYNVSTTVDDESDFLTIDEFDHRTVDCGETLYNDSTGIITLPNNPTGYLARINCIYILATNRSSVFWFDVSSFNMTEIVKSFSNCYYIEPFTIKCTSQDQTFGARNYFSICGSWSQSYTFFNCRKAEISIRSQYFDLQESYQIPFKVIATDEICGNTYLSASDGVITSPGFPLRYPRDINCTYSIPAGNDSSVSLHFSTFKIDSTFYFSVQCLNDWLMIKCSGPAETNPYAGIKYCGGLVLPTVIHFFNCSILQLTFFSSPNPGDYRQGFNVSYTRETDHNFVSDLPALYCGQTLFLSTVGEIQIPYNGSIPVAKINCTYTILANSSRDFIFSDRSWNDYLGSSENCIRHQISVTCITKITSDSTTTRNYCGGTNQTFSNNYLRLSCNEVVLALHTISYYHSPRLKIPFLVSDCGTLSFSGSSGFIKPPSHPTVYESYSKDLRYVPCIYTIDIGQNKTVSLNFLEFYLEGYERSSNKDYCPSEWIIIRCIGLSNETLQNNFFTNRKLCGRKWLQTTLTGCISILFEIVGDFGRLISSRRTGFLIEYTTHEFLEHCGNTSFADLTGVVTSPGYPRPYAHGLNCTYLISVGTKSAVLLKFTLFAMHSNCDQDWLSINCHPNETMDVSQYKTTKLCGIKRVPFLMMLTSCLYLTLNFVTNSPYTNNGFSMLFEIKPGYEDSCGDKVFTDSTGTITSPNYPLSYPRGLNCTYTVAVGYSSTISLEFLSFDLYGSVSMTDPWSDECSHDWLMISCPSSETEVTDRYANRKLCGLKEVPFATVFSSCPEVTITFTANSFVTKGGFMIKYQVNRTVNCRVASISRYTGLSKIMDIPSRYFSCSLVVPIGQGNTTTITVDWLWSRYRYRTFGDCDLHWVIFTLTNCESTEMADAFRYANRKLCSSNINSHTPILFSNCQHVTLFLFNEESIYQDDRFEVTYSSRRTVESCGKTSFNNPVGVLAYRNYRSYEKAICTYTVETGNVSSVLLTFLSFSVGQISSNFQNYSCPRAWITIRCSADGETLMHPSLGQRFCGDKAPQPILFRNCSILQLNFASTYLYYQPSFVIHYLSIEQVCGKELFFDSSGIISLSNYKASFNCSYSIVANDLSTFSITISSVANSNVTTCQEDWILLQVACIDGEKKFENKLSYEDCSAIDSRTQLLIFDCKAVSLIFHSQSNRSRAQYLVMYDVSKNHESVSPAPTNLTTVTEDRDSRRFTSVRDSGEYKLLVSLTVILAVTIVLILSFLWLRRSSKRTGNSSVPKDATEFEDSRCSKLEVNTVLRDAGSYSSLSKLRKIRSHFQMETRYLPLKSLSFTDQATSISMETLPPQIKDSSKDLQPEFQAEATICDKL